MFLKLKHWWIRFWCVHLYEYSFTNQTITLKNKITGEPVNVFRQTIKKYCPLCGWERIGTEDKLVRIRNITGE